MGEFYNSAPCVVTGHDPIYPVLVGHFYGVFPYYIEMLMCEERGNFPPLR